MLKKIKSRFTIVSTLVIVVWFFSYYFLHYNILGDNPSSGMKELEQTSTSYIDTTFNYEKVSINRLFEKYEAYISNNTVKNNSNSSGQLQDSNELNSSTTNTDVPIPIATNTSKVVRYNGSDAMEQNLLVSMKELLNLTTLNLTTPKNVTLTSDLYEHGFQVNSSHLCPNNGLNITLVILITSAPGHSKQRDGIRYTWGHFSRKSDVTIAFLLGRTENLSLAEEITKENSDYSDMIIGNFIDSYDNLTLKSLSAFEWITTYCNLSNFNLKTDDDVFINVPNLLQFISTHQGIDESASTIYGSLAKKWRPFRVKASKYYVSKQQFHGKFYPDFTTGPAYLYNPRIANSLFHTALQQPYLKLEDVFLTGIVAGEANIARVNSDEFGSEKLKIRKTGFCKLMKLISIHEVSYYQQFELWKRTFDKQSNCKINTFKMSSDLNMFFPYL